MYTYFVYNVPHTTRVTFFKVYRKSATTRVRRTVLHILDMLFLIEPEELASMS